MILTENDLQHAFKTCIGGHHTEGDNNKTKQSEGGKTAHEDHFCPGISIAQRTWQIGSYAKRSECVCPVINGGQVKEARKGARQSQKQSDSNAIAHAANATVGSVTSRFECSEDEVQNGTKRHQTKRSEDGRLLLNALQYEMVERFADQVCVELRARIPTIMTTLTHCVGVCMEDLAQANLT